MLHYKFLAITLCLFLFSCKESSNTPSSVEYTSGKGREIFEVFKEALSLCDKVKMGEFWTGEVKEEFEKSDKYYCEDAYNKFYDDVKIINEIYLDNKIYLCTTTYHPSYFYIHEIIIEQGSWKYNRAFGTIIKMESEKDVKAALQDYLVYKKIVLPMLNLYKEIFDKVSSSGAKKIPPLEELNISEEKLYCQNPETNEKIKIHVITGHAFNGLEWPFLYTKDKVFGFHYVVHLSFQWGKLENLDLVEKQLKRKPK